MTTHIQDVRAKIDKFRQSEEPTFPPDSLEGRLQAIGRYAGNLEAEITAEHERLSETFLPAARDERLAPLVGENVKKLEQRLPAVRKTIETNTAILESPPAMFEQPIDFQDQHLQDFLSKSPKDRAKFAAIDAKRDPKFAVVIIKAGQQLTGLTDATFNALKESLFTYEEKEKREQAARELSAAQRTGARISRSIENMRRY